MTSRFDLGMIILRPIRNIHAYVAGFVQDCSDSIVNALESLQSCTKPGKSSMQQCKVLGSNYTRLWKYNWRGQNAPVYGGKTSLHMGQDAPQGHLAPSMGQEGQNIRNKNCKYLK